MMVGKTINVSIIELNNPPIVAMAMGLHRCALELRSNARGTNPKQVVNVVIKMGRIRFCADWISWVSKCRG